MCVAHKNFPIPSRGLSLTKYSVADGIPPDGSNILLVHNGTCTHTIPCMSVNHRGERKEEGSWWEWRGKREMDAGIRGRGHEATE